MNHINPTKFASYERLIMSLILKQCQINCNTHTDTQPFYSSVEFAWDNPGEPVPEGTWHLDESEINLIQFSLVMSCCNFTLSVFRISQGSVSTLLRCGGWNSYQYMYRSLMNLRVKIARKYVGFWRSYVQKYVGIFLIAAWNGDSVLTCIFGVAIFTR